jgi:hypothetical protein
MIASQGGFCEGWGVMAHTVGEIVLDEIREDMPKLREPGYYWVRRLGESRLQVGQWTGLNWYLSGREELFTDDDFAALSVDQIHPSAVAA